MRYPIHSKSPAYRVLCDIQGICVMVELKRIEHEHTTDIHCICGC